MESVAKLSEVRKLLLKAVDLINKNDDAYIDEVKLLILQAHNGLGNPKTREKQKEDQLEKAKDIMSSCKTASCKSDDEDDEDDEDDSEKDDEDKDDESESDSEDDEDDEECDGKKCEKKKEKTMKESMHSSLHILGLDY